MTWALSRKFSGVKYYEPRTMYPFCSVCIVTIFLLFFCVPIKNEYRSCITIYLGWARVSYTQFVNMGQLGYSQSFDARFAITYDQTGPTSSVKPSYLKGNAFSMGFSPQIGFFGAEEVTVQDNCMYRTVGGGQYYYSP